MQELKNIQLTDEQLEQLSEFVLQHADYSLLELMAFFTAILSGPRVVKQEEWMEFLELHDEFALHDESPEIVKLLLIVYNNMAAELNQPEYKPAAFTVIQESGLPGDEITDLFLDWIDGFWLGLELFGDDWVDTDHTEAEDIIFALGELDKHLLEDETEPEVTPEDFEFVQTSVKAFHDYWVIHRGCSGKPMCKVINLNTPKSEIN